jgi:hypothetical protein
VKAQKKNFPTDEKTTNGLVFNYPLVVFLSVGVIFWNIIFVAGSFSLQNQRAMNFTETV